MKTTEKSEITHFKKTILSLTILTLFLIIGLSFTTAQDDEQESEITVEIEEETIVDIQPDELAWGTGETGLPPGSVGGIEEEQNDYGSVFVENLGSVDIENIWFETSSEEMTEDPFLGEGTHDPSNFIVLGEDLEENDFEGQFVDRKEFAMDDEDTEDFLFMEVDDGWNLGRLRVANQEFFWAIDPQASGGDGQIRIANEPRVVDPDDETQSDGGDTDLTDGCDGDTCQEETFSSGESATTIEISSNPDGSGEIPAGTEYCAIADFEEDEGSVRFVNWNPETAGADEGGCEEVVQYGTEEPLAPGDFLSLDIRTFIPFGIPANEELTGELRILAQS